MEIGAQLIKTATGSENEWKNTVMTVSSPPDPYFAAIEFVESSTFEGKRIEDIISSLPENYPYSFVFFADERTMKETNYPCLVVDLIEPNHPSFRANAITLASIENNLSIANMGFEEFAEAAKETDVFNGF